MFYIPVMPYLCFFSQVTKDKETVSREQQNIGFLEALKPEEKV